MRQPARTKGVRRQVSRTLSLPAPVGGWNARDPLPEMDPKDAVKLDNWFPIPSEVQIRKGSESWVTGFAGPAETLMAYQTGTASKLFAVVDVGATAEIYDVTTQDVDGTPPTAAVTSLTNARFQYVNFSTSGGSFLLAVNGADKMRIYTGSAWDADGGGTYTVTNVDTADCIHINMHMRRIWLIEDGKLVAWYLPVNSIAGAASSYDFRSIFPRGGYLMAMETWTLDAGQGLDDHAVFLTSEGEIAVFKGTDPSSANTWSLVGVFYAGKPIGRRCIVKMGGDMLLICQEGLLAFSKSLMSSRVNTKSAISDKIQSAVSDATTVYGSNFGWQIMPYPAENMLILNVPTSSTVSHQYVMNTISGAWCRFLDWNALCWAEFNGEIYYGGKTSVVKAWTGYNDDGLNIQGAAQQAYNYFGSQRQKHWKAARPIIRADTRPGLVVGLNVDFEETEPTATPTFSELDAGVWDTATWDSGVFGGDYTVYKDWITITGIGYAGALHIKNASNGNKCAWASTDFLLEDGAVI